MMLREYEWQCLGCGHKQMLSHGIATGCEADEVCDCCGYDLLIEIHPQESQHNMRLYAEMGEDWS